MGVNITIKPENWFEKEDKWFVNIPYECAGDIDTILEFTDEDDYIKEHQEDFDSLNNGITENNMCIISADHKVNCDINVEIKTLEEAGGEILYEKDGTPKYIPDNTNFDFTSLLSGLTPEISEDIKGEIKTVNPEI